MRIEYIGILQLKNMYTEYKVQITMHYTFHARSGNIGRAIYAIYALNGEIS